MSILYSPWTSQPQQYVGIDFGNPITRRLVFATGARFVDSVTNGAPTLYGVPSYTPTISGVGLDFSGGAAGTQAAQYATGVATDVFRFGGTLHVLLKVGSLYLAGSGNSICGKNTSGTAGWALRVNASGKAQFLNYGTGTDLTLTGNTTLVSGRTYLISVTTPSAHPYSAGGARIFVNGIDDTASSNATTGPSTTDSAIPLKIGGGGNGTRDWSGQIILVSALNRAQSAIEIRSISQNPWQIFKPLPRHIFAPLATGGGTTAVTADHNASYTITGSVTADASAAYAIRSAVTADAAASYALRAAAQADQAAAYAIRAAVASDLASSYAIQSAGTVSTGLDAAYAVRGAVAGDISVGYQIAAAVQAEVTAAYAVRAAVQKDLAAGYAIQAGLGAVSADLIAAYVINGSTTTRAQSGAGPSIILPGSTRPGSLQTSGRPPNLGGRRH